jgi:hypothetical protein
MTKRSKLELSQPEVAGDWFHEMFGVDLRVHKKTIYRENHWGVHKIDRVEAFLEYFDHNTETWKKLPIHETVEFPGDEKDNVVITA